MAQSNCNVRGMSVSPPEGHRRRNAGPQEMGSEEGPFPGVGMENLALVPTEMAVDPFLISYFLIP